MLIVFFVFVMIKLMFDIFNCFEDGFNMNCLLICLICVLVIGFMNGIFEILSVIDELSIVVIWFDVLGFDDNIVFII